MRARDRAKLRKGQVRGRKGQSYRGGVEGSVSVLAARGLETDREGLDLFSTRTTRLTFCLQWW